MNCCGWGSGHPSRGGRMKRKTVIPQLAIPLCNGEPVRELVDELCAGNLPETISLKQQYHLNHCPTCCMGSGPALCQFLKLHVRAVRARRQKPKQRAS